MQSFYAQLRMKCTSCIFALFIALCLLLSACSTNIGTGGTGSTGVNATPCQNNCGVGTGVQGVRVFVEPNAGEQVITNAMSDAHQSIWLEMYLLSDTKVIYALEDAVHKGIDVRVMLEPRPYGASPPTKTMDKLSAAGVKVQATSPDFKLTHEKGMIIDGSVAYIMTSNYTRSALGGYSNSSSGNTNREYGIIDTNQQDVQAMIAIFSADWNHTTVQLSDPNLVVSPINSRTGFTTLINSAHKSLLIEAEEMQDNDIEQALASAAQRGVQVQVILPYAASASIDDNSSGYSVIKQAGALVREDQHLYMHAKIIIVDGQKAFVGSENISTSSLDANREVGIIVADQNVIGTLQQTFQHDWNASQGV